MEEIGSYREEVLIELMESISNRRLIQHLRTKLFKQIDIQPKDLKSVNLTNSTIEKDIFYLIKTNSEYILHELQENRRIYRAYFGATDQGPGKNVRDMLLPGEEDLFIWDQFYLEYLEKFLNEKDQELFYPVKYYQKLYDFVIKDMTYNNRFDYIKIVE